MDVTIAYPRPTTFWEFLGGEGGEVTLLAERFSVEDVVEAGAARWLANRWRCKDATLAALAA